MADLRSRRPRTSIAVAIGAAALVSLLLSARVARAGQSAVPADQCVLPPGWYRATEVVVNLPPTSDPQGNIHYESSSQPILPGRDVAMDLGVSLRNVASPYDAISIPVRARDPRTNDLIAGHFYRAGTLADDCSIIQKGIVFAQGDVIGPPAPTLTPRPTASPTPTPSPTPVPTRAPSVTLATTLIDFGQLDEASLRSEERVLELVYRPGSSSAPAPRITLSLIGADGAPFPGELDPAASAWSEHVRVVLVAAPGQELGPKTGFLVVHVEGAQIDGADRIPVRYELVAPPDLSWLFWPGLLALAWLFGVLDNRIRRYRSA